MAEFTPKDGPFRRADISRNSKDRANRNVAKALEAEYGLDPTALTCDFGTPEMAEGLGIDPQAWTEAQHTPGAAASPPEASEPTKGKRTNGADPTPGMPGA